MVLRGSKTKPDIPLTEAIERKTEADRQLLRAENDVKRSEMEMTFSKGPDSPGPDFPLIASPIIAGKPISTITTSSVIDARPSLVVDIVEDSNLREQVELSKKKLHEALMVSSERHQVLVETVKQLVCGGLAGAVSRTIVGPLDRIKLLMQTSKIKSNQTGTEEKYHSTKESFKIVTKEEGWRSLWRGNLINIVRVAPYSGIQFASYDLIKKKFWSHKKKLETHQRLIAGACAGITATTLTHPLDVVRLRLSIDVQLKGTRDAFVSLWNEGGIRAMYKGWIPTVISVSPFIAINFATFDVLKQMVYPNLGTDTKPNPVIILSLGGLAGIFAQTICYPLDTIRRRMQMKGKVYTGLGNAFVTILREEGVKGYYKGIFPNAIKVVPNNAIRFVVYEWLKTTLQVQKSSGSSATD